MTQFTVGFLPWWPQNPYQVLLKKELNARNVRVIGNPPLNLLRILLKRDGLDIVHIHWPHGLYARKPWRFPFIVIVFVLYRLLKNNLVWTVHELEFHEPNRPVLDRFTRWLLMKICKGLIVHGEDTARKIRERFNFSRNIRVVAHPHYGGWYADNAGQDESRKRLGLPSGKKIYLFFGCIKPYKGLEDLIQSFSHISGDDSLLVIAGNPVDDAMRDHIGELCSHDHRISTHLKYIPDDEVQFFFRAADIVVFPFRDTQTSGSIMLALTFGMPIVAPAVGTIPEYVSAEMAELFDPQEPGALLHALKRCQSRDFKKVGEEAKGKLALVGWEHMGTVHMKAYQDVISDQDR